MNRVEKRKLQKMKRRYQVKLFVNSIVAITIIFSILVIGLMTVDKNNRQMMFRENRNLFNYSKIASNKYKVVFCGDEYELDTERIAVYLNNTSRNTRKAYKQMKKITLVYGRKLLTAIESLK